MRLRSYSSRAACLLLGCIAMLGCSRYSVRQTSLVPPAISMPAPASDLGADLALTGNYLLAAQQRSWFDNRSLWVTRAQGVGMFEYAFRPVSIRVGGFNAPSNGAERADAEGFRRPPGSVWGGGAGVVFRWLRDDPKNDLFLGVDVWLAIAPSRTSSTCIENCTFSTEGGTRVDRSAALMLNNALSYRHRFIPQLGLVTGFGLQTLFDNRALRENSAWGGRSKIRMGAPHPIFHAAIEVSPARWMSIAPTIEWSAPPTPMLYGPSVGLTVRVHPSASD